MSYIGRYPNVTLKTLTIGKSKPVDSIASSTVGSSTTSLINDAAIYNYINTFEIIDFNASLSDANVLKCKTESLSSQPHAITKRNNVTCVINSENFQCKYHDEIYVINNDIDVTIPTVSETPLNCYINTIDNRKIDVTFGREIALSMQEMHNRVVSFKHDSGTCFIGKFIYKTEITGTIINVKYFNIVDKLTEYSELKTTRLYNLLFSPKEQSVKALHGSVIRSNKTPTICVNGDIWLNVKEQQWYYYDENQWKPYDGFLIGQVIQDILGILACSTSDTQHLLVNFNNSLLQHNTYNVMNYHGNSHVTVDKNIVEAPLNERLTWPRYQTLDEETVYCYIDSNGQTHLDETLPMYRDNVEYLCHPIHFWRCIGYANFVNGKFTDVKTFDRSDFQTALETVYYNGQVLLEVNGNIGTNRVDIDGRIDIRQTGYFQLDLVGGGGGGAGDTHRHRVNHTWVTHSYSDNSFACQGSSASYISVRAYLERADYITFTVGYGGHYRNGDAGETAIHGSNSYCRVFTHNQNIYMTAPHGYTSSGTYNNHALAPRADAPSASGLSVGNQGVILAQVQGNQGRCIYHEDHYYIDLEANVSPVNNQPYCWGAGGKSVNSGHNSHTITNASHGIGGWFKLTYLGQSI